MIKSALVCIAKDEDNYINEWIDYHLRLGFDRIFVYCNDWDWFIPTKYKITNKVEKITFNGDKKQVPAYDDFISKYYKDFDFACFIDIDEFVVLKRWKNINTCLSGYLDVNAFLDTGNKLYVPYLGKSIVLVDKELIKDIKMKGVIYVPYNSLETYKSSPWWDMCNIQSK